MRRRWCFLCGGAALALGMVGWVSSAATAQTRSSAETRTGSLEADPGPSYPSYYPGVNGYPRDYYAYAAPTSLPTYLTSINYPQTYGAYTYGIPPGSYTYGAMPSGYTVAPSRFHPFYPLSVPPVLPGTMATSPPVGAVAYVQVRLPVHADIWFESVKMSQAGSERLFVSPALVPGRTYAYHVRATWTEDGREVTREQRVRLRAGDRLNLDFTAASWTRDEPPTLRTRPLP